MDKRVARYAPSPTGPLHLGNLQTALGAWLQARLFGCEFWLRIENLDISRCKPCWTDGIVRDLNWLGLDWDKGPGKSDSKHWLQSERRDHYESAIYRLADIHRLYPCSCSRRDIQELANAPHGPLGSVYPGTCRKKLAKSTFSNIYECESSLRFAVETEELSFTDKILGKTTMHAGKDFGDFVVYRRDSIVAYHLAVVVDDILAGVTDIFRGEDLLSSVFPQLCLYEAMGENHPQYWHSPLRKDDSGNRLSKREQSASLQSYIDNGVSAEQIIGTLGYGLGLVEAECELTADELLKSLTADDFSQALRAVQPQAN